MTNVALSYGWLSVQHTTVFVVYASFSRGCKFGNQKQHNIFLYTFGCSEMLSIDVNSQLQYFRKPREPNTKDCVVVFLNMVPLGQSLGSLEHPKPSTK